MLLQGSAHSASACVHLVGRAGERDERVNGTVVRFQTVTTA
jgi:hypothetical protein